MKIDVEVDSFEVVRDPEKPRFLGFCSIVLKPIGIRICNIRLQYNRGRKASIVFPANPRNGGWSYTVSLPDDIYRLAHDRITEELTNAGLLLRPPPDSIKEGDKEPMVFNPDEIEEENVV